MQWPIAFHSGLCFNVNSLFSGPTSIGATHNKWLVGVVLPFHPFDLFLNMFILVDMVPHTIHGWLTMFVHVVH